MKRGKIIIQAKSLERMLGLEPGAIDSTTWDPDDRTFLMFYRGAPGHDVSIGAAPASIELDTPTQQEVVKELNDQIDSLRRSYKDADGIVRDENAKKSIACLETAIAFTNIERKSCPE